MAATGIVPAPKEIVPIPRSTAPLQLAGLDHLAILVPDLVEAERWYVDVLGARIKERYGWGGGDEREVPPHVDVYLGSFMLSLFLGEPKPSSHSLIHCALHCDGMEEIDAWHAHLVAKGVPLRGKAPTGHGGSTTVSLYFQDPWGYWLEIATHLADAETARAEVEKRDGMMMTSTRPRMGH